MKIKIKRFAAIELPSFIDKGEWIDLRAANTIYMPAPIVDKKTKIVTFDSKLIPLGIAMQLPKGFEAHVLPRSSTFKKYGIIQSNSQGIIDSSYCGDEDQWLFPAIALKETGISSGERICQFRIMLSQKATVWQKLKWLFTRKIQFVEVEHLGEMNRGGFGSTGV